ncbi:hypothetical protein ACWT_6158 [Actinoplanes sp. SE50]|nr:hypothetical protein ACPL_6290 [Actinoplanes sp. SE50/110]ATO85573.1 hypothetical protein ACWT_6158 [Actinoplanes sp. SE50]SLM02986.1 hypothetical protein ACSP50_6271 [Actinoplanes sp. SE50/110]
METRLHEIWRIPDVVEYSSSLKQAGIVAGGVTNSTSLRRDTLNVRPATWQHIREDAFRRLVCPSDHRHGPNDIGELADSYALTEPVGCRILFKLSVRLQGGPKRAAHAAAWARAGRLAGAHDRHAGSPSAGVQERIGPRRRQSNRRVEAGEFGRCRPVRPGRRGRAAARGRSASHGRRPPGAAARSVSGPLLRGQGRFASQATAASGRPGPRSLCGPSGQVVKRQADGLPAGGRAPPHPVHPTLQEPFATSASMRN